MGDLAGADARRINSQHRLVYQGLEETRTLKVLRRWSHHGVEKTHWVQVEGVPDE